MSNYNEDDDDMFDDEDDMMPQTYWAAAPDENVLGIDAVLNHRLREDTSQYALISLSELEANPKAGKEITDPGRDDFEYYVSLPAF